MIAKNDKQWHRLVCERDNYVCHRCKRSFDYPYYFNEKGINQMVCGHHLKKKNNHPELRLDTDNGVCTCDCPPCFCHTQIHKGN